MRDLLVYCANYMCSQGIRKSADRWPDHVRLSDLEPLFVFQAFGRRGAEGRTSIGTLSQRRAVPGAGSDGISIAPALDTAATVIIPLPRPCES